MFRMPLCGVLALLLAIPASPSLAEPFAPCADAATDPALAGSLRSEAEVPLQPDDNAGSGNVALFVRKFPAPDPHARKGEVWLVAGGPGESGAAFHSVLDVMRRAFPNRDLMIADHRGTGFSGKLCPVEEALGSPGGIALTGEEWGPCIGAMHASPQRTRSFTVTNAAHDLAALVTRFRTAGEVHIYAVSYGTQLVLRMMQVAPVAVDGIVLDGLVPPEADPRWDLSRRTEVVDKVGRAVITPDQARRLSAMLAVPDAEWRGNIPGGDARRLLGALLTFPDLRDRIPHIIAQLERGDATSLAQAAHEMQARVTALNGYPQSPPSLPLAMLIGSSENNHRPNLTVEDVEREAADALFVSPIPGLLVRSPAPRYPRDMRFGQSPSRLPRTLVIHGTLDPNTPYEGARQHAGSLAASSSELHFATVKGGAHYLALVAPDCFIAASTAFLAGGAVPQVGD